MCMMKLRKETGNRLTSLREALTEIPRSNKLPCYTP